MSLLNISNQEVNDKFKDKMKKIKDEDLERVAEQKAQLMELSYFNLDSFSISADTISIIDEEEAKDKGVVCFFYNGSEVRVAFADEDNLENAKEILKKLEKKMHSHGIIYFISQKSFQRALRVYNLIPKILKVEGGVKISPEDINKFQEKISDFREIQEQIKEVSLTDLMTLVIASALKTRSSDIHIEAEQKDVKLRFRIDGVLYDVASIEKSDWPKIISRIKLISKLKLNVNNKPQDGRFSIFLENNSNIDVRVSCLPTSYGESVVMRILSSSVEGLNFDNLGLREKPFKKLMREIHKPNGMIMTTGPTGSGKTTTLYAVLTKLNSPDKKIITLEDPIEYKLKGINQSQIDHSKNYTFAKGLRSILRQDPDVVLVGEIRDEETTDIAINAALTGHLVLSTVHTNSAAGSVPRFLSLGAKPYLLAPALNVVIGQRLLRRICPHCKKEYNISEEEKIEIEKILAEIPKNAGENIEPICKIKFYKGEGCEKCQQLGYKGRIGIYEVMIINDEIKQAILEAKHISEYNIQKIAQKFGMITMKQDGILKAIDGITTLEEVFRVAK